MKVKLLPAVIAACSFFSIPFAGASTYQSEISATYGETDLDDSSADISDINLHGTYYFSSVDTANRPLAESAFLQKASSIYIGGDYSQYKENDSEFNSSEKSNNYSRRVGVDFYIPNTIFFLGAGITEFKYKSEYEDDGAIYRYTRDWDSLWHVKAGITPVDGLLVWSQFYEDIDVSELWNVNAKYVLPIGSNGQWLNLEARYANSDDGDAEEQMLTLAGDYYLDSHLSIGGGVTHYTYDEDNYSDNENEYFIRANQYFTDNFAANLNYTHGDHENSWAIGATLRF